MHPRLVERAKPEVLGVVAAAEVLLDYLGGYPSTRRRTPACRSHCTSSASASCCSFANGAKMLLPWKDVTAVSVERMMDPQRQRSLARTVEFGVLGGGERPSSPPISSSAPRSVRRSSTQAG